MHRLNAAIFLSLLLSAVVGSYACAQDQGTTEWQWMPGFVYVKHFPGDNFIGSSYNAPGRWQYEGSALLFRARAFNAEIRHVAFTVSGGFEWYSQPDDGSIPVATPAVGVQGIGQYSKGSHFTGYPIGVGAQYFAPDSKEKDVMFFVGGEVVMHLVDASAGISQQARPGFNLLGGFAVRFVEFGVQYSVFSDMKNLGAYFGLRFNQFGMK